MFETQGENVTYISHSCKIVLPGARNQWPLHPEGMENILLLTPQSPSPPTPPPPPWRIKKYLTSAKLPPGLCSGFEARSCRRHCQIRILDHPSSCSCFATSTKVFCHVQSKCHTILEEIPSIRSRLVYTALPNSMVSKSPTMVPCPHIGPI